MTAYFESMRDSLSRMRYFLREKPVEDLSEPLRRIREDLSEAMKRLPKDIFAQMESVKSLMDTYRESAQLTYKNGQAIAENGSSKQEPLHPSELEDMATHSMIQTHETLSSLHERVQDLEANLRLVRAAFYVSIDYSSLVAQYRSLRE